MTRLITTVAPDSLLTVVADMWQAFVKLGETMAS